MSDKTTKPVLVTTEWKGVFAGRVPADADLTVRTLALSDAMMSLSWQHRRGVMGLADQGPCDLCLISGQADIPVLHGVTAVFAMTEEAWEAWIKRKA